MTRLLIPALMRAVIVPASPATKHTYDAAALARLYADDAEYIQFASDRGHRPNEFSVVLAAESGKESTD